jgi:hypothetical protein
MHGDSLPPDQAGRQVRIGGGAGGGDDAEEVAGGADLQLKEDHRREFIIGESRRQLS